MLLLTFTFAMVEDRNRGFVLCLVKCGFPCLRNAFQGWLNSYCLSFC